MTDASNHDEYVITAAEFQARCLNLIDEVASSGSEITISKRGKPIVRLVPYQEPQKGIYGVDKETVRILGDIVEPLGVEWEAMQNQAKKPDVE
ncbi:MAG: type II toxin-antitoxin system prevent-host-death family antitoxin [Pseudomonadales bacterium]|nr:type II toxin-antitoxin system prevent-host-death family antitoxin [Pseudomonadales bacterium]